MSTLQEKLEEALRELELQKIRIVKQIWEIEARQEQIKEKLKMYGK